MTTDRRYCPDPHTFGPGTTDAWREWAVEMGRTHEQHKCPDCGLWVIWRPRTELDQQPQQSLFDDGTSTP